MKKFFSLASLFILLSAVASGQVSISQDASSPDSSAMLDVKSTNKGVLIPRIALAGTQDVVTIPLPQVSLLIYNTATVDDENTSVKPGFYYWNGLFWAPLTPAYAPAWSLTGNAGINPATQFIGTTDNQPLIFRVNNQMAGKVEFTTRNTYFGYNAGQSNTSISITAIGSQALYSNTTGSGNTAVGVDALSDNTTGGSNTAVGGGALNANTTAINNTAIGAGAMNANTTGENNSAVGLAALNRNREGSYNTAQGSQSLVWNTGSGNTASGFLSLYGNTTGENNTALGNTALYTNLTGNNNTAIGSGANVALDNLTNATAIGAGAQVACDNCLVLGANSRTGIGTSNPHATAALEIASSDKGLLIPRMTQEQRNAIASPANGLLIYQTNGTSGFYYYNSTVWTSLTAPAPASNLWATNGNSNIAPGSFIGTTDAKPLLFKVNNIKGGSLDVETSSTYFGVQAGLNTTGLANTGIGQNALVNTTNMPGNTAVGAAALFSNTTGSDNTGLGRDANVGSSSLNNATAIGARSQVDCNNCLVLGSVSGVNQASSSTKVGIGTTSPSSSAALEIASSDKGLLLPRMTVAQRNAIASPANGLLVYQTDGTAGLYAYNGVAWTAVTPAASQGWSLTGNAGTDPATQFIGTTDNKPLILKVSNQLAGKVDPLVFNTFFGYQSGAATTDGHSNAAFGYIAMQKNTSGIWNTAIGNFALQNNTTSNGLTALGSGALRANTTGSFNTATGIFSLEKNTIGYQNTGTGHVALYNNTSGYDNTATGSQSLLNNSTGHSNTASGFNSLILNTTGNSNVGIGKSALYNNKTGNGNTAIGTSADVISDNLTNATAIGAGAVVNASNKIRLGNPSVTSVESAGTFNTVSDGRYKFNVLEDVKGLDFILKLKPVTYQFDETKAAAHTAVYASYKDPSAIAVRRTGFIAQEVEKAAQSAGYDFNGVTSPKLESEHYSLSYASFVVPLVKAVQEQQQQISNLKKENEELKRLKQEVEELKQLIKALSVNHK